SERCGPLSNSGRNPPAAGDLGMDAWRSMMTESTKRPVLLLIALALMSLAAITEPAYADDSSQKSQKFPLTRSDAEWRKQLTPEQYHILREQGTERAYTGKYDKFAEPGIYRCAACGNELFKSNTKFDAGEGWPSFYAPAAPGDVVKRPD